MSKLTHQGELLSEYVFMQTFGGGYYRGGFDPKMNKREAALILGVRYVNRLFFYHPSTGYQVAVH